jgi:hypothetical protein
VETCLVNKTEFFIWTRDGTLSRGDIFELDVLPNGEEI